MRMLSTFILALALSGVVYAGDASSAGGNAGRSFLDTFGSKDALNKKLYEPLVTDEPLSTTDGSATGDARLMCRSSKRAVTVQFLPVGFNEYRALVRQDLDLDGDMDALFDTDMISGSISGVCTNGIVSCAPAGSWNGCRWFAWVADASGKVSLAETEERGLAGTCECSNSSCGGSFDEKLFTQIGGGIAQAIMNRDSRNLVSKAEFSTASMTLSLYGQSYVECSGINAGTFAESGETNPQTYYKAGQYPDGTAEVMEQSEDPESLYSLMQSSMQAEYQPGQTIGMPNRMNCAVTNEVTVLDGCPAGYSPVQDASGTVCVKITETPANWETWPHGTDERAPLSLSFDLAPGAVTLEGRSFMRHWYFTLNLFDQTGAKVRSSMTVLKDDVEWFTHEGTVWCSGCAGREYARSPEVLESAKCDVSAWGYESGSSGAARISVRLYEVLVPDSVVKVMKNDTCTEMDGCDLVAEAVCSGDGDGCVDTVRDGTRIVSPEPMCVLEDTGVNVYTLCADGDAITLKGGQGWSLDVAVMTGTDSWFRIERTYECGTREAGIDLGRAHEAVSSAELDGGTISYLDNGSLQTISGLPSAVQCGTPVCTVRAPESSATVFSDGTNRSETSTGKDSWVQQLRVCDGEPSVCPVDSAAGETIIEDCSCAAADRTAGAAQSLAVMDAINGAVSGMICSGE